MARPLRGHILIIQFLGCAEKHPMPSIRVPHWNIFPGASEELPRMGSIRGFSEIPQPIRASPDIQFSGYPETWISGNPDIRISGYPDFRTSGYPEIRNSESMPPRMPLRMVPFCGISSNPTKSCFLWDFDFAKKRMWDFV